MSRLAQTFLLSKSKPMAALRWLATALVIVVLYRFSGTATSRDDFLRDLQTRAITDDVSPLGHWGPDPAKYTAWGSHSNRLLQVYRFGTREAGQVIDLGDYTGPISVYRSEQGLRRIYGRIQTHALNPRAEYLDKTDLAAIQRAGFAAGK